MRILMIATNRHHRLMSHMDARPLPIGMAYVAGHLDQNRHTLKLLDLMFSDDYLSDVETAVKEFGPDLVGVSLRNLSNHSYMDPQWALPITKEVIECVRSNTQAPIVLGGPAFSLLPRECFSYLQPDLGIAGDAGETFAELANRLEIGEPSYQNLPGLVYQEAGQVIFNGGRCTSEFSKPPRLEDLDMPKYRQAGFGIGVLTKLGDFSYPTNSSGTSQANTEEEKARWRVIRPVDEVVREVKEMEERFGLRKVFFIDNGFNVPIDHAKSLCHGLINADLSLHWNTCMAPFSCDAELVGLMKQAGCALVIMGNTRGDPHDGASLNDRLEPLLEVCRLCEEGDLHYTISQTFGEPGETRETVGGKLAFLRNLKPAVANLRVGVSIMPGSEVASMALAEGTISGEAELIRPTFYLADAVKPWLVEHLKAEADQHPRWNLV